MPSCQHTAFAFATYMPDFTRARCPCVCALARLLEAPRPGAAGVRLRLPRRRARRPQASPSRLSPSCGGTAGGLARTHTPAAGLAGLLCADSEEGCPSVGSSAGVGRRVCRRPGHVPPPQETLTPCESMRGLGEPPLRVRVSFPPPCSFPPPSPRAPVDPSPLPA